MLEVLDLHTYYGDSHVLQGTTLRAERGTVTAVLGRNGVGKTTLCRSLAGLTPARRGQRAARWRQHDAAAASPDVQRGYQPGAAGPAHFRLVERPGESPHRGTAGEIRTATGRSSAFFELFPRLAERRHHGGGELSGGEQQMLAIARALIANPRLLIMDEPTEGLAPALVAEVARLIRRLRDEGTTVLLVEQNAAFAVDVSDVTHVMHQGTIVHSSAPAGLWENEEIKSQYLGVPGGTKS